MIRQYYAHTFKPDASGKRIGVIPIGSIWYPQDNMTSFGFRGAPIKINPWIVVAWENRDLGDGKKTAGRRYGYQHRRALNRAGARIEFWQTVKFHDLAMKNVWG